MVKRILKWIGYGFGGLLGLLVILIIVSLIISGSYINRVYNTPDVPLTVTSNDESVANGARLTGVFCSGCHGGDLGGGPAYAIPLLVDVNAPNLTTGVGGLGDSLSDGDFERAIRHGVGQDGKSLWSMSSTEWAHFSNQDVADIIAYVRSVDPVDNTPEPTRLEVGGRVALALSPQGRALLLPATAIDHEAPPVESIERAVTVEYGEYLARTCIGCHQPDFAGGPFEGGLYAANLTPNDEAGLGTWTEEDFLRALREGVRPDGSAIDPAMPYATISQLDDVDLKAMWVFLQSLPPIEADS